MVIGVFREVAAGAIGLGCGHGLGGPALTGPKTAVSGPQPEFGGTRDGIIGRLALRIASGKAQNVQSGLECHAPLDLTWSCYREEQPACGSCGLRLRAFGAAGVPDPIAYAQYAGIFIEETAHGG